MKASERILQIQPLWEQGLGITEISKLVNLDPCTVSMYINMIYGHPKTNNRRRFIYKRRVYNLNEHYFKEIDTEDKAYFLGLLAADGNMSDKHNTVEISLQEEDGYILEKFREFLRYDKPNELVNKINSKTSKKNQIRVGIYSGIIKEDLQKWKLTPRKSISLEFSNNIPKNMISHYIRGYFDGDGCVYAHPRLVSNIEVNFAGSIFYCNSLAKILILENINTRVVKHSTKNCFYAKVGGGNNILNLYNYLYKDATLFLIRKKDIFEKWFDDKNKRKTIILQYDLQYNFIKEWDSVISIVKALNKPNLQASVGRCCKGYLHQTGGFIWKYKN
ncbi:MAG TPA: hypothetical protein VIK86_00310 [Candidatus Paceibacterota bacterium]